MAHIFLEPRDMDDELRRLFDRLDVGERTAGVAAECTPPLDVVETTDGILVMLDLAGVSADSLKVVFVRNTIVVAGHKLPAACEDRHATFHLAERAFGRFARGVRVTGAFDAGRADATLEDGVLRVRLPRIEERRGGERRIHVQGGD